MTTSLLFNSKHCYHNLLKPKRYKILYSGRGSAKSWTIAEWLVRFSREAKLKILCVREYQTSMTESCHALLVQTIARLELDSEFTVTQYSITHNLTQSEFIFKGLAKDPTQIKSLEGVDICWCEEADLITKESWDLLLPTIRKENSEIVISFNPSTENTETYQRFVVNTPTNSILMFANYTENPFCSQTLINEAERCRVQDLDTYNNRWLGLPLKISNSSIFKDKFKVEEFDIDHRFDYCVPLYGLDFGFANDPSALVRCYLLDNTLYINLAIGGVGIDTTDLVELLNTIPDINKFTIQADCARPETISAINRGGLTCVSASKWGGSIADGITYLKSLDGIIIHPSCTEIINEFENYSWKVDRNTGNILPIPIDKYNNYCDALRYALVNEIKGKDDSVLWAKLGSMV